WEYPWYAAWDLAFHTIPLALVDPDFAKAQLVLFLREWYMHPNGQIPAYEWAFGDVNPPVHAWAALRVYRIERRLRGKGDREFFEHFVYIAHAVHDLGDEGINLWDDTDGFYYDVLHGNGTAHPMKVRSMVGLIPLFAVETLEPDVIDRLPGFKRRMQWFIDNHPEFREHVETAQKPGVGMQWLLAIVCRAQLPRVLRFMLDEAEFL